MGRRGVQEPNTAELADAARYAVTRIWPVHSAYAIREGLVLPASGMDTEIRTGYTALARRELPAGFARLADGGDAAILAFVRTYGLLGYPRAFRDLEATGAQMLGLRDSIAPGSAQAVGDPVSWIVAHATAVKLVGELSANLSRPEDLRPLVERLLTRGADNEIYVAVGLPERGAARPAVWNTLVNPDDAQGIALGVIARILNENLSGVVRQVNVTSSGALRSVLAPSNLLDCVYWLLADAVTSQRVRSCDHCRRFFVATDERMKHCPPAMGIEGPSPCLNRAKQTRWRQRAQQRAADAPPARSPRRRPARKRRCP